MSAIQSGISRWLKSFLDVRKGETLQTVLMVFYIYLILITYYLLKPARDSLFLSNAPPELLPLVFVLIAVVVVPVTTLYARISRSLKLNQLVNLTIVFIISNLFVLRWLLTFKGQDWVFYVFYIWVSIYGALTTSQFWLFANAVFDASQAKRIFGIFSLAAILGAFTGGEVTSLIVSSFGVSTENLLYFCAGFLLLCIPVVNVVWTQLKKSAESKPASTKKKKKGDDDWAQVFRDIKDSKYLRLIMGIIAMTMATASFVDYQFKFISADAYSTYQITEEVVDELRATADIPSTLFASIAPLINVEVESKEEFTNQLNDVLSSEEQAHRSAIVAASTTTDKNAFTGFLGNFYGRLSLIGLLLQFFLSLTILRKFGVGGAIMFLPLAQIFASVGMLIAPTLVMAVLLRGSDGVFKYSIDKTGRELLFLPVPLDVKSRSKVFIDLFIDRVFRGISGLVLLFFTLQLNLSMRQLSMVVIGMVALWLVLDILIRREYVNAFRTALSKGEIDSDQLTVKINDASTVNYLLSELNTGNERQTAYILGLLGDVESDAVTKAVQPFLQHSNIEIRRNALAVVANQPSSMSIASIEPLLQDEDIEIRAHALFISLQRGDASASEQLRQQLDSGQTQERLTALACLELYLPNFPEIDITPERVTEWRSKVAHQTDNGRAIVARIIGKRYTESLKAALVDLAGDPSAKVREAAIEAMGASQDRKFIPILLDLLSDKACRRFARKALASFGERVLGTLQDYMLDSSIDISVRKYIPRVFQRISGQAAADTLTYALENSHGLVRYMGIRSLNRMRNGDSALQFRPESLLTDEIDNFYRVSQIAEMVSPDTSNDSATRLLAKAVNEHLNRSREKIFRLLSLSYPAKDVYDAYLGLISTDKNLKASSVEFLTNLLSKDHKADILPIIDPRSQDEVRRTAEKRHHVKIDSEEMALKALLEGRDNWLRVCAVYSLEDSSKSLYDSILQKLREMNDPLLKDLFSKTDIS